MPDMHRRVPSARASLNSIKSTDHKELLTTKEVAALTGLSTSFFEKGRIYGYGPNFIKLRGAGSSGKVMYSRTEVCAWLNASSQQ